MPKQHIPPGLYLGLDYGHTKIGVATGQTITGTTTPLTTIKVKQNQIPWQAFDALIEHWKPVGLVVGLALNLDGSLSKTAQATLAFCKALEKRYHLPIFTIDEHLSTCEARDKLKNNEVRKKTQIQVDAMAAAIILESWLQQIR